MSNFKIGDVIDREQANSDLPHGTVLRGVKGSGDGDAVAIRQDGAWVFVSSHRRAPETALGAAGVWINRLAGDEYEVLYRPEPPPAAKVGDVITTTEEANRLPVGSAVVCLCDSHAFNRRVTVKHGDDRWSGFFGDRLEPAPMRFAAGKPYRVIFVPDANADTGGAAA